MQRVSSLGAFTLLAIACLTIMVGCVIVPALPSIASQLGTPDAAGLLVTIPSLGVVIFGPVAGKLIDRVGLYKAVCIGLFFYGALGAGGVFLHGYTWVFADRLLLGGATALVMAGGTGLISALYSGKARLGMIAKQGMSIELGGVIFLFIGGLLATISWQWPFVLYLVSWLMLAMLLAFVPRAGVDPAGRESEAVSNRQPVPAALKRVFIAAVFSMLAFFTAIILLPLRLQEMALTEAETGYFLSFVSFVAVLAAAGMPKLVTRTSEHSALAVAFFCYSAAHLVFVFGGSVSVMAVGGIFMGVGFGFSVPLVNHMTVEQSHPQVRGRNLAYLSMAIFSGQFLCSAIELFPQGDTSLLFAASALVALLVCVWAISGRGKAHTKIA
ncbi:MFS transporter [Pseudomonas alloputida]|uniref:MFS transporter n=1 Tax=Pseudomonas TaxID=286 RepID=UPI003EED6F5F